MRRYYVIFMSFERIDVDCIDECDVLIFLVMLVLREWTSVMSCIFWWELLYFHHMSIFVLDDSASSHCDEINMCMMLCQAFCDTSFCMYFNRLHAIAPRPLIILPRVPDTFRRRSCLRLLTYRSSEGLSFQQIETLTRPARQVLPTRVSENLPLFHACYFEVSPRFEVTPLTIISFSGIGRLETPKTLFRKGLTNSNVIPADKTPAS